ncbi:MAG: rhodanese-like domain-containing protein [Coxiellaceae bacterium]|nr:rhodanese-like domain-containing protein [Coxiellaceae bacterium]
MDQVLHFIAKHWALCAAFVVVLLMVLLEEGKARGRGGGQVNPEGAVNLINREDAAVLDLRSKQAFEKGHMVGAINIAKADIEIKVKKLQKYQDKPLIIVCERGNDSNRIALKLRRDGFQRPLVLAGGIEAWKAAKLPLATKK